MTGLKRSCAVCNYGEDDPEFGEWIKVDISGKDVDVCDVVCSKSCLALYMLWDVQSYLQYTKDVSLEITRRLDEKERHEKTV